VRSVGSSVHFWIGVGLFCCYWTAASILDVRTVLLLTNSLYLSAATAAAVAYLPTAIRAIRARQPARVQHIALGIGFAWAGAALWRIWSLLWYTSGQELWMIQNDLVAFFQAMIALGALYHLTSPGAVADLGLSKLKPQWARAVAVGGVVLAALVTAITIDYLEPDTRGFTNAIKDWVPR
jgi:hypothetical protein